MSDARYRWVVVAYTMAIQAVSVGMLIYSFALFAVPWLDEFGAPRRDVMLMVVLLQVGVGVASPFIGHAMDRFSMRSIVLVGLAALAIGYGLCYSASALWQLQLVFATLFPAAMGLMGTLASQTLVARWFNERRGLAIGLSAMGTNIGGMVFPLLVGAWLVTMGWRDAMMWLATIAVLLVGPATWFILSREPLQDDTRTIAAHDQRQWQTREILTTRMFWIPVLCLLPINIAFGAVQFNLGAYSRDLGLSPTDAASLIALASFCMILGKLFFGALGDRIDHRQLYWVSAFFMAVAMVILIDKPDTPLLIAGICCVGLSGGGILPLLGVIFGSRFGVASFGRVMGLVMLSIMLGAVGPFIAGWVYDLTGSYDIAFMLFLACFAPAVIAIYWMPEQSRSSQAIPAGT